MIKQIGILSLVGTIVARKAGGGFNGELIKKALSVDCRLLVSI